MDVLSYFKTRAQLAGLLAAACVFLLSSGVLGVVLLTTKWDLKRTRGDLIQTREDLAVTTEALGTCHAGQAQLQASIDGQNAAIEAMKVQASEAEKAGLRKLTEARFVAQRYKTRAEALAKARPANPADICGSAKTLIVETLGAERGQ